MSLYVVSLLSIAGINIMLAVSLNLITGFCGQISLGHGAFFGAGAYAAALCAVGGLGVPLALIAGLLVAGCLGLLVGFASVRLRDDFLAVTTIGMGFLLTGFVRKQHWLGAEMGISRIPATGLGATGNALMIAVFAVMTIAFSLYLGRSWMGFAFRAVGDDEEAARTLAIPAPAYKLAAFGIGTAIAGLAGGLYTYFTRFIVPDSFGFILSLTLLAMVVIGGTGSTWGAVAGAVVLTLLPEVFSVRQRLPAPDLRWPASPDHAFRALWPRGSCLHAGEGAAPRMSAILAIDTVSIRFGGVQALSQVSFSIERGEFAGLIGPNGAGKTTLLKIIAGVLRPDTGRILLGGEDLTTRPTAVRVRKGLAMTHQIVRPFRSMSVLDNVALAAGHRITAHPLSALFKKARRTQNDRAREILARTGLGGLEDRPAGTLPLGRLKRLELARALALDPTLVLLDEPLAGLNHREAAQQAETIAAVHASGTTVLLIEHNLAEVLRVCRRLLVLDGGRIIADGRPAAVMAEHAVREAYIGKSDDAAA